MHGPRTCYWINDWLTDCLSVPPTACRRPVATVARSLPKPSFWYIIVLPSVGHQSINQSINKFNGKNAQDKKGHKATCPLKTAFVHMLKYVEQSTCSAAIKWCLIHRKYTELSIHANIYLNIINIGSVLHWWNHSIKVSVERLPHCPMFHIVLSGRPYVSADVYFTRLSSSFFFSSPNLWARRTEFNHIWPHGGK